MKTRDSSCLLYCSESSPQTHGLPPQLILIRRKQPRRHRHDDRSYRARSGPLLAPNRCLAFAIVAQSRSTRSRHVSNSDYSAQIPKLKALA